MAAHKTNPLLKWSAVPGVVILGALIYYLSTHHPSTPVVKKPLMTSSHTVVNTASQDSAAESLDTLTVQWSSTEQRVKAIVEDNTKLQQDNKALLQQLQEKTDKNTSTLTTTVTQLQSQIEALTAHPASENPTVRCGTTHSDRTRIGRITAR